MKFGIYVGNLVNMCRCALVIWVVYDDLRRENCELVCVVLQVCPVKYSLENISRIKHG
jgi:hypothetical protein